MKRTDGMDKIIGALREAHFELTNPIKNKTSKIFTQKGSFEVKYADLPSFIDHITPILWKSGLVITQTTNVVDGGMILLTTLIHTSGQFIESEWLLPKDQTQMQMGASLTLARRYSLAAILNLAADEDKGEELFSIGISPSKTDALNAVVRAKAKELPPKEE